MILGNPMKKSKLPVERPSTKSIGNPVPPASDRDYEARERKYKAQDALRTIQQADEHRKDKELMKDVKNLAKAAMKAVSK